MNYWNNELKIGTYSFCRFIGGPVDGVINSPFRCLIREFSPHALLYTEIRHVNAVIRVPTDKWRPLQIEQPINFQMTAQNPQNIAAACEQVFASGISMVDINIGCPSRLVTRGGAGAGSALMADIPRLTAVIKEFRRCLPTIPLTVKMRAGYKEQNALEIVSMLEDWGIDAICIHPRLQPQKHQGELNYSLVADIKKKVKIPILFSGGITNSTIAKQVYEQTGVDGFLIGRGLLAKPWLIKQLHEESQGRSFILANNEIHRAMIAHLDFSTAWHATHGLAFFKKHLVEYLKELELGRAARREIVVINCPEKMKAQLSNLSY